jgi:hypothetical protein
MERVAERHSPQRRKPNSTRGLIDVEQAEDKVVGSNNLVSVELCRKLPFWILHVARDDAAQSKG